MIRGKSVSEQARGCQPAIYGRVLLTGTSGFLGGHVLEALRARAELVTVGRRRLAGSTRHLEGDLRDERVLAAIEAEAPDAVVHLAAITEPDRCEREPAAAEAMNARLPGRLARRVAGSCRFFLHVSTDLVFDGRGAPYDESAKPAPLSVYGRTKLSGERAVREVLGERATVVRLALLYGARRTPSARPSFAEALVRRAAAGEPVDLFTDQVRSPLYAEDAALALGRLLEMATPPSLLHLGGPETRSRYEMGLAALRVFDLPEALARACLMADRPALAERPRDVSLDASLAEGLGLAGRPLEDGLRAMKLDMGRSRS